jgi:type I restriction enzyme, S subunit
MEVRPGYKRTEFGAIPDEWDAATIGGVASFSGGSQPAKSTFRYSYAEGYIRLIQIRDYKTDEFETYIPASLARKRCSASDIMIGRYGPPIFQILRGIEGAYNVALIKATPNQRIDREFLFNVLQEDSLFQLIDSLSRRSSGQTGIEMPALKARGLPLPPLPEQRTIATALGDVDAQLGGLDRLIAKKRDLKQAAMQQLLTGQTRLPGFQGDWKVKQLGDVVEVRRGQIITGNTKGIGDVPVIAGGKQPAYYHNVANRQGRTITISASGASAGYVALYSTPIFASDCSTIGEGEHYCLDFVFYQLVLKQQLIYKAQTGGAQPHIHPVDLMPIKVGVPPLDEQTAIAAVLSDMDAELAALEARRNKTRDLKQAMMQELLTGRTRLVRPEHEGAASC